MTSTLSPGQCIFTLQVRFSKLPADVAARDEAALADMEAGGAEQTKFEEFKRIIADNDVKVVIVNGSKYVPAGHKGACCSFPWQVPERGRKHKSTT